MLLVGGPAARLVGSDFRGPSHGPIGGRQSEIAVLPGPGPSTTLTLGARLTNNIYSIQRAQTQALTV